MIDWIAENPLLFVAVLYPTVFAFIMLFDLLLEPTLDAIFFIYVKIFKKKD